MTNGELISAALRLIGVLEEGETPSAEQGADGLSTMNDLFLEWNEDGVDIGFYPQTSLSDDSPIADDALYAARYNLALSLSSEYGVEPRPAIVVTADKSYSRLLRELTASRIKEADMKHVGYYEQYDIENG